MAVTDYFSEHELEAVRAATEAAETQTGGELVCVIVERSDLYEASSWKAATFGALAGVVGSAFWLTFRAPWGAPLAPWILLLPIVGAAVALLAIILFPWLQRALTPHRILERRVDRRASQAFLEEEIFATRERTGVLLFLSLFEHQIRILRDRGVEERIPASAWDEIALKLAKGMRAGQPGSALVRAIEDSGQLLAQHGVERRADDTNELSDAPRLHDE